MSGMGGEKFMKCKNCGHIVILVKKRTINPYIHLTRITAYHFFDGKPAHKCFCGCDKPEPESLFDNGV